MAWPPGNLPNDRTNTSPQLDLHAPDHNDIANTLANDFAPQVSANLAQINANLAQLGVNTPAIAANAGGVSTNAGGVSTNAGGVSTNAGNIASNTGDIAIARQNFLPGGTPSVRGNSVRLREADNTDIGSGFVTSVEVSRHLMTGPDVALVDNVYTVLNGTTVLAVDESVRPVQFLITAVFDFGAIGTAGLCQGAIEVDSAPGSNTAVLLAGHSPDPTRATVSTLLAASISGDVTFRLSARTLPGSFGTCFAQGTMLTILKISS